MYKITPSYTNDLLEDQHFSDLTSTKNNWQSWTNDSRIIVQNFFFPLL